MTGVPVVIVAVLVVIAASTVVGPRLGIASQLAIEIRGTAAD